MLPRDRNTAEGVPLPRHPNFNEKDVSDKPEHIRQLPLRGPGQISALEESWQQQIESLQEVDRGVRDLIRTLRKTGELDQTVVIFTSDNGFSRGEHRRMTSKLLPYEEMIRAPLVVRGPGFPAGSTVRQPVAAMQDLAPTILDLAGLWRAYCCEHAPMAIDGRSVLPLIDDPNVGRDRAIPLEGVVTTYGTNIYRGVRTPHWKYVRYLNGEEELYRLTTDPWELHSLHDDPRWQEQRDRLAVLTSRLATCSGVSCRDY